LQNMVGNQNTSSQHHKKLHEEKQKTVHRFLDSHFIIS